MKKPILTVVMPIYNGEKHVREAIDSVLNQTFTDFEFIIINDGSTDQSLEAVSSFADKRIRLLSNDKNRGIPYSRNRGLKEAKGDFLCWTDCDDLNLPQRFEKQILLLQNNSHYGGCGTWLARFKDAKTYYINRALEDWKQINASLLFSPATIPNPTVMLRLSEIIKHNIQYNPELPIGEDYDFIFRCSRHFKFTNIQEVLYKYRDSETSIMKRFDSLETKSIEIYTTIITKILEDLDIVASDSELSSHLMICSGQIFDSYEDYKNSYFWMKKIDSANAKKKIYDTISLKKVLSERFFFITKKASKFGFKALIFYVRESWANKWNIGIKNFTKLFIRCLLRYDKFKFERKHFFNQNNSCETQI